MFLRRATHCASMVTLFVALSCASLPANQQNDERNPGTEPKGAGANSTPLSSGAKPNPAGTPPSDTREQQDELQILGLRLGSWAEWVTAAITVAALWAAWLNLKKLQDQIRVAEDAADAAKANSDAIILAERAYIAMAGSPKGFHFRAEGRAHAVLINVMNHGRTPGSAHGGKIGLATDIGKQVPFTDPPHRLPNLIEGFEREIPGAFLVSSKQLGVPLKFNINDEMVANIKLGRIWLVGYIDYTDQFGRRHRGGYARKIGKILRIPRPENNLLFDSASARHNYDIEIDEQGQPKKDDSQEPRS